MTISIDSRELWQDIVAATSGMSSYSTALRVPLFIKLRDRKQSFGRQTLDILAGVSEFLPLRLSTQPSEPKGSILFCFAHRTPSNMNNLIPVAREVLRRGLHGTIVMGGDFRDELREFVGKFPMVSIQELAARIGGRARISNLMRLFTVYRQISAALSRLRPMYASALAANRGAIVRDLVYSMQCHSASEMLIDNWSPSCVISTSDFWPLEHQLCCQASLRGIPNLVIQHGTIGDFWWPFVAEMYCMWGDTHVQQMEELGAPPDRMKVLGMPATDEMFRNTLTRSVRPLSHRQSPDCLILSHTQGAKFERDAFESYRMFIADIIQQTPFANWKVKLHPKEDDRVYREMGASVFNRLTFLPKDISLQDAIADSDVVTTLYSTAGLEAMVLGRPLIVAPAISRVRHLAPWPSMGGGVYATDAAEFRIQLERLYSDPEYRDEQLHKQKIYLSTSFANQGNAAKKIADLLEQYSQSRSFELIEQGNRNNASCLSEVSR